MRRQGRISRNRKVRASTPTRANRLPAPLSRYPCKGLHHEGYYRALARNALIWFTALSTFMSR